MPSLTADAVLDGGGERGAARPKARTEAVAGGAGAGAATRAATRGASAHSFEVDVSISARRGRDGVDVEERGVSASTTPSAIDALLSGGAGAGAATRAATRGASAHSFDVDVSISARRGRDGVEVEERG